MQPHGDRRQRLGPQQVEADGAASSGVAAVSSARKQRVAPRGRRRLRPAGSTIVRGRAAAQRWQRRCGAGPAQRGWRYRWCWRRRGAADERGQDNRLRTCKSRAAWPHLHAPGGGAGGVGRALAAVAAVATTSVMAAMAMAALVRRRPSADDAAEDAPPALRPPMAWWRRRRRRAGAPATPASLKGRDCARKQDNRLRARAARGPGAQSRRGGRAGTLVTPICRACRRSAASRKSAAARTSGDSSAKVPEVRARRHASGPRSRCSRGGGEWYWPPHAGQRPSITNAWPGRRRPWTRAWTARAKAASHSPHQQAKSPWSAPGGSSGRGG